MVAGDTMLFKGNNSHVGGFEVKACIMSSEAHGRYDWSNFGKRFEVHSIMPWERERLRGLVVDDPWSRNGLVRDTMLQYLHN